MKGPNGGFGANPQNLRIVTLLEAKHADCGLDLTRATLDGLVKYPELYDQERHDKSSNFTYLSDKELLSWIKEGLEDAKETPIEGQLADWADEMIYSVNDIEDLTRAGLLSFMDMRTRAQEISKTVGEKLTKRAKKMNSSPMLQPEITNTEAITKLANELEDRYAKPGSLRQRKENMKQWTSDTIKEIKDDGKVLSTGRTTGSVRYRYKLEVGPKARALAEVLKSTAYLLVFRDPRVLTLEAKGRHIIDTLFDRFSTDKYLLPLDFQELIDRGTFGSKERLVADFIAGMTDSYAYAYYKRLFHPGVGSFYEDV